MTDREKLAAAIEQRFGTVHAFCLACQGLNRTTVYQVLKGTYAGNISRQLGRIQAALEDSAAASRGDLPTLGAIEECLREAACSRCPAENGPLCRRCAPGFLLQAQAVLALLESRSCG
jgi:hypothetical protein